MREMVLITCMGEMKHAYKIVVGNPEILGTRYLGVNGRIILRSVLRK
jgi:hypothetical protein